MMLAQNSTENFYKFTHIQHLNQKLMNTFLQFTGQKDECRQVFL